MRHLQRFWLLIAVLCCATLSQAADIQITAELHPTAFAADQEAEFVITVNGTNSAQPELPVANELRFRSLGQSQQTSWINGQMSATVAFSFAVQAEKPGQHTIGPVKIHIEGKEYATQPVNCTVSPAQSNSGSGIAAPSSPSTAAEDIGFLRIQPEKDTLYAGQLVQFTIKAYFKPGNRIHIKTAPRLTGENFLLHSLDKEPVQQQERLNGEVLTTLTWHGSLSAVKEGTSPLAVEVDADLMVPERKRRTGSSPFDAPFPDDSFFDDFFSSYTRQEIKFASPKKSLTALSLPTSKRPADFKGAVGTFSLAVAASPTDGKPGEPITLKMKITGTGNFDLVQAPELTERSGWKLYPAADSFAEQGNKGEKTFEQAAVPIRSNLKMVPPLRFSYFDPSTGEYVTLNSEPIPLHLQEATESVAPQLNTPKTPQKKQAPLVPPLNAKPGQSVQLFKPLYEQRRFQTVMIGAGCCLSAGLLLDYRRKRIERHPRSVLLKRQLARDCRAMQTAIFAENQEQFRQHCREAVQKWTGTIWERAAATITLTDLQERLPADSPLLALFSRLEESDYAGAILTQAEMKAMLQTVHEELDKLT